MLDFNTKKRILKKLSECADKHFLMLIPCAIAAAFVKLFYFIVCHIDIALSDKEGNFLGVKSANREKAPKQRRQDDIIYVKHSFASRFVSAVLAFAFAGMFVPTVMPAIVASAIRVTQATSIDQYKDIQTLGIDYGAATTTKYYYDPTVTDLPTGLPELETDPTKFLASSNMIQIKWTYNVNGFPVTATAADTNGAISAFEICCDARYKSSGVSAGTTKKAVSIESSTSITSGSVIFDNLDPETYYYKFYAKVTQVIHAYAVPNGNDIREYAYTNNGLVKISAGDFIPATPTPPDSLMPDPNDPTAYLPVKNTRIVTSGINKIWESTVNVDTETINTNLGAKLPAPSFTAVYDGDNKLVTVTADPATLANPDVKGYLFFKSSESVSASGVKSMSNYELVKVQPKDSTGTTGNVWVDTDIKNTKRYDYIVAVYKDIFAGGAPFTLANAGKYLTSPLPVEKTPNGNYETIYTKTTPTTPVFTDNNSYFTITWDAVEGATNYKLERWTIPAGGGAVIDDGSGTQYEWNITAEGGQDLYTVVDKKVVLNKKYFYRLTVINSPAGHSPIPSVTRDTETMELDPSINVPYDLKVASSNTDTSVNITWKCKDNDVTGFDIDVFEVTFDENDVEQPPVLVKQILNIKNNNKIIASSEEDVFGNSINSYSMKDQGIYEVGHTYRFKIRSYMIIGNTNNKQPLSGYIPSPLGYKVRIGTEILPPQEIQAISDNRQITVSWSDVEDADHFELVIEKMNGSRVETTEEKIVNGTTYVHSNLRNGDIYRYQVRSIRDFIGERQESAYTKYVYAKVGNKLIRPSNLTVELDGNGEDILVSWNDVPDADGYYLYIEGNGRTDVKDISGSASYTHKNALYGVKYSYYVVAYQIIKLVNGEDPLYYTSESSNVESITKGGKTSPLTRPTDLTVTLDENGEDIKITWKEVRGADGYYLYIMGEGSTLMKDVSTTTYIQKNARYGVTYSYYVVAYQIARLVTGSTPNYYTSERSSIETFTIGGMTGVPSDLKATPNDGEVVLTWSEVPGAAGYMVYATGDGKTETFNTSKPTFTHTGLKPGTTYSYYVVAYKNVGGAPVYGPKSATVTASVGGSLDSPIDFSVTPSETSAVLSWTAVDDKDIKGYTVYGTSDMGGSLEVDVSKNTYIHTGLVTGETWTYYVRAYKMLNNQKVYGARSNTVTVKIGFALPAPTDLEATSGNRQVDLKWTAVTGADGYIVYLYNEGSLSFEPLSIVSKGDYSHIGVKNGVKYTYMVAAFKNLNGQRIIGDYSLAVTAIPSAGSASDVDSIINIKGTAPYGISHSELISAGANHEAFDEPVDAYISVNDSSTRAVKQVLRNYANGLKSFIIYPFDIKTYVEDSLVEVAPNDGYTITFTMPVPDKMVSYRDYITVIHLRTDGEDVLYDDEDDDIFVASNEFEVLPSAIVKINGRWCIQFQTTSCSPFAFVVYKDNLSDISAGSAGTASGTTAGGFNTGLLLLTVLPDMLPTEKKTRFVVSAKKRYRIKK